MKTERERKNGTRNWTNPIRLAGDEEEARNGRATAVSDIKVGNLVLTIPTHAKTQSPMLAALSFLEMDICILPCIEVK